MRQYDEELEEAKRLAFRILVRVPVIMLVIYILWDLITRDWGFDAYEFCISQPASSEEICKEITK